MSERMLQENIDAVARLPQRLKELAEEIADDSAATRQSFHDAMCDHEERSRDEFSVHDRRAVLEAMGSYWE